MQRVTIWAMMAIASLGLVPRVINAADTQLRSDVQVIEHEWYQLPPASPSRYFSRAWSDSIVTSTGQYGMLCLNRPKSYEDVQNICPRKVSDTQKAFIIPRADGYAYKLHVYHAGVKPIEAIIWLYIFVDPQTNRELASHTLPSRKLHIGGKEKSLIATSGNLPPE